MRHAQDAASRAPAALNFVRPFATVTAHSPTLMSLACLRSVAARSPRPVIWSGLVLVKLLRSRMTINDYAAARDSHRRDDRSDQSGKST
jgi:hypothetical protein